MNTEDQAGLPVFLRPAQLMPSDRYERKVLVDGVIALTRAMLQTSFHTPDSPQARALVDEPLAALEKLRETRSLVRLGVILEGDKQVVALLGVFADPVPLATLVPGPTGQGFGEKLATFFQRNGLVSVTFRTAIEEQELGRFFHVLGQRAVGRAAVDGDDLTMTEQLRRAGVVRVAVIGHEELVEGSQDLPWRVRLALSNLELTLVALPAQGGGSLRERQEAKRRAIIDVVGPLGGGLFLTQLLSYLHLIAPAVLTVEELDLERDVVEALGPQQRRLVVPPLLDDWNRASASEDPAEQGHAEGLARVLNALGHLLAPLAGENEEIAGLLERLHDADLIDSALLPQHLRAAARETEWMDRFLTDPAEFVRLLDHTDRAELYRRYAPAILSALPQLLEQQRLDEAHLVVDTFRQHASGREEHFPRRPEVLAEIVTAMDDSGQLFDLATTAARAPAVETRRALLDLLGAFGRRAIHALLAALDAAEHDEVIRELSLRLADLGDTAIDPIRHALEHRQVKPTSAPHLLRILGQAEGAGSLDILARYMRHPTPLVRSTALEVATKADPEAARPEVLGAIEDKDPSVAHRAIRLMEQLLARQPEGTIDVEYVTALLEVLGALERPAPPHVDPLTQVAAVESLARMGDMDLGELGTLESLLLSLLPEPDKWAKVAVWRRRETTMVVAAPVRVAICEALARLGGEESADRFKDTSGEPDEKVRQHMERALIEINAFLDG